jgi:hypothetical protein
MNSDSLVHVEVRPSEAYAQRARLFAALESAFPVKFRASGNGPTDATLVFVTGEAEAQKMRGPTLWLVDQPATEGSPRFGSISFADFELVPRPFRGRTLRDSTTPGTGLPSAFESWGEVLALCSQGPVWSGRPGLQFAAAASPGELGSGETLRERLTAGRFMGLLPLVHFLRLLLAQAWELPESKACFVFDDPNLHWWSYGFLDYRRLAAHAKAHDYHVTAATIPIDQWYVHGATAEFLRQQRSRISFAIHGNNHTRHELRRIQDVDRASALAAQALERIGVVQRSGVAIAPVMVPPHGVASVAMCEGCLRAGFDALCADWPYWWLTEPSAVSPLSGWRPLDRLGGLPLIPRRHAVASDLDDLVFRAFLGQPLVLYAHHTDLRVGLDVLGARAAEVRSLGVDSWQSLGRIGQDVASRYRRGASIEFMLHSRTAHIEIPEGVYQATFSVPGPDPSKTRLRLEIHDAAGLREVPFGDPVPVRAGAIVAKLVAEPFRPPPKGRRQARAAVRRLLSESRDRAAPWLTRTRMRGA